jgi:hypothetical protein
LRDRSKVRRHAAGISVDVLVRREGAASMARRRRAHRCGPRRSSQRLAVAAVVAATFAGASTLVLMPDHGAPARPVSGESAAAPQVVAPPASPIPSFDDVEPDDVEPQVVSAEQIATAPRTTASAPRPTRTPDPAEQARPTRSPERTPSLRTQDLEPTNEIDELAAQLVKRAESSGSHGVKARDRGSGGRWRGSKG